MPQVLQCCWPASLTALSQIQRRMEEQEGHSPQDRAAASSPAAADSSGQGRTPASRGSSGSLPAAWDAQDALPVPGQRSHYQQQPLHQRYCHEASEDAEVEHAVRGQSQQQQQGSRLPLDSPASSSGSELGSPGGSGSRQRGLSGSRDGGQVVLAVSNPLFGSSRPSTAQGQREGEGEAESSSLRAAQPMHGMLPPKRSLRRRRSSSPSGGSAQPAASEGQQQGAQLPPRPWDPRASSSSLASAAALARERRQRQQPLRMSGGTLLQSLGSLGSGWEGEAAFACCVPRS